MSPLKILPLARKAQRRLAGDVDAQTPRRCHPPQHQQQIVDHRGDGRAVAQQARGAGAAGAAQVPGDLAVHPLDQIPARMIGGQGVRQGRQGRPQRMDKVAQVLARAGDHRTVRVQKRVDFQGDRPQFLDRGQGQRLGPGQVPNACIQPLLPQCDRAQGAALLAQGQFGQQRRQLCPHRYGHFRGGGRRRCAAIGGVIAQGGVRFMAHGGYDRDGTGGDRTDHRLLIESP